VQVEIHEKSSPLYGCALCIAEDGAVAVIVIDGFQLYVELYCPRTSLMLLYFSTVCTLFRVHPQD
jgi:hypothetical protein